SYLSTAYFAGTRRYEFYRTSQLFAILLLPFLVMLTLGGFKNSSAVILWSLISPLGALLFAERRQAIAWLLAFLGLLVLGAFLDPYVFSGNNLPPVMIKIFFVMNLGGVSAVAFILVYHFMSEKNATLRLLRIEQDKAENLLLNILPKDIADILKDESRTIANHHSEASILFADVVDFTPMSAQITPIETVDLLNEVFSYFDTLVERYGLEKIKTIGDCYMVAGGVPKPRSDHAHILTRMALEMNEYVNANEFHGHRLSFRIGINSGPVVAGVIGRKKFIYDLWGDAVNIASRMESQGVSGKIQIAKGTYDLIKDDFICKQQDEVYVKGKGQMPVWHVLAEKESGSALHR
ncbi:MAG: adenylate/guanylate cyclase domain-containing protein, partial [Nitrospinota bacterium]